MLNVVPTVLTGITVELHNFTLCQESVFAFRVFCFFFRPGVKDGMNVKTSKTLLVVVIDCNC